MNLVVFGATGGIGRHVLSQALAAGHSVTAVARNPAALGLEHDRLVSVRGDVMSPATLPTAIQGQDAVISTLGVAGRAPTRLYSAGLMNILLAMHAANVRRILCVSASGLDPGPVIQKLIAKPLLWTIFKEGYTDMAKMEVIVQASDADWTILRPPRLTDEPHTGKYNVAVHTKLPNGWKISRADVADYIVNHLTDAATYRAHVELAY